MNSFVLFVNPTRLLGSKDQRRKMLKQRKSKTLVCPPLDFQSFDLDGSIDFVVVPSALIRKNNTGNKLVKEAWGCFKAGKRAGLDLHQTTGMAVNKIIEETMCRQKHLNCVLMVFSFKDLVFSKNQTQGPEAQSSNSQVNTEKKVVSSQTGSHDKMRAGSFKEGRLGSKSGGELKRSWAQKSNVVLNEGFEINFELGVQNLGSLIGDNGGLKGFGRLSQKKGGNHTHLKNKGNLRSAKSGSMDLRPSSSHGIHVFGGNGSDLIYIENNENRHFQGGSYDQIALVDGRVVGPGSDAKGLDQLNQPKGNKGAVKGKFHHKRSRSKITFQEAQNEIFTFQKNEYFNKKIPSSLISQQKTQNSKISKIDTYFSKPNIKRYHTEAKTYQSSRMHKKSPSVALNLKSSKKLKFENFQLEKNRQKYLKKRTKSTAGLQLDHLNFVKRGYGGGVGEGAEGAPELFGSSVVEQGSPEAQINYNDFFVKSFENSYKKKYFQSWNHDYDFHQSGDGKGEIKTARSPCRAVRATADIFEKVDRGKKSVGGVERLREHVLIVDGDDDVLGEKPVRPFVVGSLE